MANLNKKTSRIVAFLSILFSFCILATFCVNVPNAKANENGLSTTALVTNVSNATVSSAQTKGSYKGVLVTPNSATESWNATINSVFTETATVSYLLPNQSVANMANGFTVKDSKGNFVMSVSLVSRAWSYCQGGIYTFDGTNYVRPVYVWDAGVGVNYWSNPNQTATITDLKTILGNDFYIAPKHGIITTGPHNYYSKSYNLATAEGTLTFDYDADTQNFTISTTTLDVEGFDAQNGSRDDMVGAGQTIVVGSRNYDLSEGYTISLNNVGSFGTQEDGNYVDLSTSSAVLITDISGVDLSTETVTSSIGSVVDFKYHNERTVNGVNYIESNEGELLKKFDVYANFNVGNLTSITSSVVGSIYYADDNFNVVSPGEYEITLSHGGCSKNYTVVVNQTYKQPSETLITSTTNATITANVSSGSYSGLQVKPTSDTNANMKATINGVFTGKTDISFLFVGSDANDAHSFSVYDINGTEVLRYVTFYRQAWQSWGTKSYVYAPLANGGNGAYYKATNGEPVAFTDFSAVDNNDVPAVMPIAGATDLTKSINSWGTYYYHDNLLATLSFDYSDGNLTVSINTPQRSQTADGETYTGTNPSPTLKMASIPVDLSLGYTISINSEPNALNKTGNYKSCKPVLITEINGINVAGATTTAVIGEVSNLVTKGGSYDLSSNNVEDRKIYVPQYSTFVGGSVNAYNEFSKNWVDYLEIDNATLVGNYDTSVCANYSVKLQSTLNGAIYSREVTLVVEPSRKITLNANNGENYSPIYLSDHYLVTELPTPIKYGWTFSGWFTDNNNQVTELTAYSQTMTLTAKWSDNVKPVLTLNNLSDYEVVEFKDEFIISATDVIAEDEACGLLTGDNLVIYVKAPNTNDYVLYSTFNFDRTEGEYLVKYVATDVAGNSEFIIRTIKYMPVRPTISVDGEFATQVYLGTQIELLNAQAFSGQTPLTVDVSVTVDGSPVTVVGNKFTTEIVGVYTVVYLAENENELIATKSFTIQAIADTVKPVISVDFTITEIKKGETLNIPVATATDNCDATVNVIAKIMQGEELIATESTVINVEGVYTVVYVATDNAGNVDTLQFEVFVKGDAPKAENSCSSALNASSVIFSLTCLVVTALILKKKEN